MQVSVKNKNSNNEAVKSINLMRFIGYSLIGIIMFLVPIPSGDSFNTVIGISSDFLKEVIGAYLPITVVILMNFVAIGSVVDYIFKPDFIRSNKVLTNIFSSGIFYVMSKVAAAIISILVYMEVGPEIIISGATGGTMLSLSVTLMAMVFPLSIGLPFLTDCGIMEFLGIILRPVVKILFKVPGRASVDLITSWFGASNAAAIVSREQYAKGYYTKRETATIMTNFSLVSIPFCLVIAGVAEVEHLFPAFYAIICFVGILLAMIMPRLAPLKNIEDTYYEPVGKQINEELPEGINIFNHSINEACKRVSTFKLSGIFKSIRDVMFTVVFGLIPTVIAWGTLSLIIVEHTPIFEWLSYPMGLYLDVLGVEEAFKAAPATLVGFTDMFIPALLMSSIESVRTRFIISILSLVQIIYLTEVGAIIIQSNVDIDIKRLAIIFLQRTLIALPIIVLLSNLVF